MNDGHRRAVELLLDIAPHVFAEPEFALKGGTAINLFVQQLPRLSVDIDIAFVPIDLKRDEARELLEQTATNLARERNDTGLPVRQRHLDGHRAARTRIVGFDTAHLLGHQLVVEGVDRLDDRIIVRLGNGDREALDGIRTNLSRQTVPGNIGDEAVAKLLIEQDVVVGHVSEHQHLVG